MMNALVALLIPSLLLGALTTAFVSPSVSQRTSAAPSSRLYNDLWGEPPPEKDGQVKEMSKALPFAPRPKLLDGTLAGDVGFEYVSKHNLQHTLWSDG
jgi:hypothetical protein